MLKSLRIENIAIIEKADITFNDGLNVLTGETGAGKSIIIDSINVILGERTSKELIRTGEQYASVTAYFENIGKNVFEALEEIDVSDEGDGSLLLYRKICSDGRNVCKINGCPVTVSMLKQLSKSLINIHGQNDSQFLLSAENHYKLLDGVAKNNELLSTYQMFYKKYVSLKKELKSLNSDEDEKKRQYELLLFQINEIEKANIKVGEIKKLEEYITRCRNSQKILKSLNECNIYFNGDDNDDGIILNIKSVLNILNDISSVYSDIENDSVKLSDLFYNLEDVSLSIENKLKSIDFDSDELERSEERLDYLLKLQKKYGNSEQEILEFLEECKIKMSHIENSEKNIEEITKELNFNAEKMVEYAEKLSQSRKESGKIFIEKLKTELEFLDMPGVSFSVRQNDKAFSLKGKDDIELMLCANEGESEKSLSKTASGGELSRIMLAIKNVTSEEDEIETMIFDEIDTGVSGKTAEKIGIKLYHVSKGKQVICVTHSAQVASKADSHYLIEKSINNNHTYTQVRLLSDKERKYELARIIGGVVITQGQLKVAEEMLKGNYDETGKN